MATKSLSKPTKLPSRGVLNTLGKSKMTIQDYAKTSPLTAPDQLSPVMQLLRRK